MGNLAIDTHEKRSLRDKIKSLKKPHLLVMIMLLLPNICVDFFFIFVRDACIRISHIHLTILKWRSTEKQNNNNRQTNSTSKNPETSVNKHVRSISDPIIYRAHLNVCEIIKQWSGIVSRLWKGTLGVHQSLVCVVLYTPMYLLVCNVHVLICMIVCSILHARMYLLVGNFHMYSEIIIISKSAETTNGVVCTTWAHHISMIYTNSVHTKFNM